MNLFSWSRPRPRTGAGALARQLQNQLFKSLAVTTPRTCKLKTAVEARDQITHGFIPYWTPPNSKISKITSAHWNSTTIHPPMHPLHCNYTYLIIRPMVKLTPPICLAIEDSEEEKSELSVISELLHMYPV
ncbi:hypothetical protein TWF706_001024 [Orbilia oligospora]|nr:hypothetical protein TWF706_001024 [Orbilia oligospora]